MKGRVYHLADHGKAASPGSTAERCAGSAASGPGLSKGHIVTTHPSGSRLKYWRGAGLLQVRNPYRGDYLPPPDEKAKRGEIIGHSPKSQRRARLFLSKIPNEEIMKGLLVTLTYPGKQAADKVPDASEYQVYKEHLRRFNQAVVRKWGGSGAWFLEFQVRGAPHYHLIVFGVAQSKLEAFQQWVSFEWNRIVDGGEDHLKAGTKVEIPKNCNAARNYVTAYFTKGAQALSETKVGRYWGKFGTKSIPVAEEVEEDLSPAQAKIATRIARRLTERRVWNSGWRRLHVLVGKSASQVRSLTTWEFRRLCENGKKHKTSHFLHGGGGSSSHCHIVLELFAMLMKVEKVRFPQRFRHRNNATINLFCDSSSFAEALKRHPAWDSEAEPIERRAATASRVASVPSKKEAPPFSLEKGLPSP